MRFITTNAHGYVDYLIGVLLIIAPWIGGFALGGAEIWVTVLAGVVIILYSLFTDYELGISNQIEMRIHLWIDGILGALVLLSPWIFRFAHIVWVPHVVVGIVLIAAALTTQTVAARRPTVTQP